MRFKNINELQVLLNILKGEQPTHLNGLNADELFYLFQRHRLFPLGSGIVKLMNKKNREKWNSEIRKLTIRSLHQTSVLGQITKGFESQGIEVIPLKGPVLAQSLYGNLGSRHFVDLDILIRGKEIERILDIAKGLGYSLRFPKPGLTSKQWAYYFRYKKDIGLVNRDRDVFIELHTGIDNHKLLNHNEEGHFWKNSGTEKLGGTKFQCLNHENTFLYLAFHGGLHQYTRLFWLRDVAEALERWDMDHQKILSDAKMLGIERLLGVSLELLPICFNSLIPEAYMPFLKAEKKIINRLKHLCMDRFLGAENLSFADRLKRQLYIFLLKPGISYKWIVIRSLYHRRYITKFFGGR